MNVAVIAPTQIPARTANTLQVMKMTQAIAALGHDVRLAVPWYSAESISVAARPATFPELARHYGLQTEFPIDWLISNPNLRRYDFGYRAASWARRWGADVVYTRLPQAAAFASGRGQKTILEVHDLPQGRFGPWFFRCFLGGSGATRLVVITRSLAADLAGRLGRSCRPALHADRPGWGRVTFHVGSQCRNPQNWRVGIERAKKVFADMQLAGLNPRLLNSGGGYPVRHIKPIPSIEIIAEVINDAIADLPDKLRIMAEPGRYLVSDSAYFVCRVVGTATRNGKRWMYWDAGMFGGVIEITEGCATKS